MIVSAIGKTILVSNTLSEENHKTLCEAINNMIENYERIVHEKGYHKITIPIRLLDKNDFLCIVASPNTNIVKLYKINVDSDNNTIKYMGNPIINGDELNKSILMIKNSDLQIEQRINASMHRYFQQGEKSNESFDNFVRMNFDLITKKYLFSDDLSITKYIESLLFQNPDNKYLLNLLSNVRTNNEGGDDGDGNIGASVNINNFDDVANSISTSEDLSDVGNNNTSQKSSLSSLTENRISNQAPVQSIKNCCQEVNVKEDEEDYGIDP